MTSSDSWLGLVQLSDYVTLAHRFSSKWSPFNRIRNINGEAQQWSVEIYGTLSSITTSPTPPVSPFPSPTLRIWLQYIPSIREINVFCGLPGTMNRLHGNGGAAICVCENDANSSPLFFSLYLVPSISLQVSGLSAEFGHFRSRATFLAAVFGLTHLLNNSPFNRFCRTQWQTYLFPKTTTSVVLRWISSTVWRQTNTYGVFDWQV